MIQWAVARLAVGLGIGCVISMGCVAPGGIIPEENSSNTGDWEQSQQIAQLPAPGDLYPNDTCDGIDNDGDTRVDESCYCTPGDIQDCYIGAPDHAGVGACALGRQECFLVGGEFLIGGWGACTDSVQPTLELCGNSVDEDCDGVAEACDDPSEEICGNQIDDDCDGADPAC
jgi:hypothetical protein